MRQKKNSGFTLIELLAVAAVIALAAFGSVSLLMRDNQKWEVRRTAQQLALAAKAARIQAVQNASPFRLLLDQQNRRFFVVGASSDPLDDSEETVISTPYSRPVSLPASVQFEKIIIADNPEELSEIEFLPNGSAKTAVIQIGSGQVHATVTVLQATGRVKVTEGELETITLDRIDLDEIESPY